MFSSTHFLFNPAPPKTLYVDINSCFATIEQQANPLLRNKPVVVAASTQDFGCILASSTEAKALGIKTGMRVKEAKQVDPFVVVLGSDPDKYRYIHHQLHQILLQFVPIVIPKSIDEFCLRANDMTENSLDIAWGIKEAIKTQIGNRITVSIGIAPNQFLAKTASNLHKPDGLDTIDKSNIQAIFQTLTLTDLCGISTRNALRLRLAGILDPYQMLQASPSQLKSAFRSITAAYWYQRLHGYEIDDVASTRRCFGNSYVLPKPTTNKEEIQGVVTKLIQKMAQRLRSAGFQAQFIDISVMNTEHSYWHESKRLTAPLYTTIDFLHAFHRLMYRMPLPVKKIAITCAMLTNRQGIQLNIFDDVLTKHQLTEAVDQLNCQFGDYTVTPASIIPAQGMVPDAIAFGQIG